MSARRATRLTSSRCSVVGCYRWWGLARVDTEAVDDATGNVATLRFAICGRHLRVVAEGGSVPVDYEWEANERLPGLVSINVSFDIGPRAGGSPRQETPTP